jgi:hypothetical protein
MKIDWKIWNYKGRKVTLARFVLCCLAGLAYAIIFLTWPEKPSLNSTFWFPVLMVVGCVLLACFFGYRAFFFSDDWFRAKEAQRADWWDGHPRLRTANNILGLVAYFSIITYLLWQTYRK